MISDTLVSMSACLLVRNVPFIRCGKDRATTRAGVEPFDGVSGVSLATLDAVV